MEIKVCFMYVSSVACVRIKEVESKCFRIESGVRSVCITSPWLFNVYMNAVMKEVKMLLGQMGVRFLEEGRECGLPDLLYADDWLVLCSKSEEEMKVMVGCFVEVCRS